MRKPGLSLRMLLPLLVFLLRRSDAVRHGWTGHDTRCVEIATLAEQPRMQQPDIRDVAGVNQDRREHFLCAFVLTVAEQRVREIVTDVRQVATAFDDSGELSDHDVET